MEAFEKRIAVLPPLYSPGHEPGGLKVRSQWAYVPPVRPGFALNLDREETTVYGGISAADADARRVDEFPIQTPNRYPSKLIERALTTRIAEDLGLRGDNLLLGNGIMSIMTHIYDVFSGPLERILVPTPGFWPAYTYAMQRARGLLMPLFEHDASDPLRPRFGFPMLATREALSRGASICYLCNPNNPTGTLLSYRDLGDLIREFPKTMFILDEAYAAFAANLLDTTQFGFSDGIELIRAGCSNLLVARTFSKAYGMANCRVGFIVSHEHNTATLRAHMGPYDMGELSIAMAYYNYLEDSYMRDTVRRVCVNKQRYESRLESAGIPHYGGFRNSILVASLLMGELYEQRGIAVRAMVYQEGIPNVVGHTFRVTIPADDMGMRFFMTATDEIVGELNGC